MMIHKPTMDVIAPWTTARWNVKIQKMKFRNHRQRILTTALQCPATKMMMPKTDIMHDVDNICDMFYNSPLIAPDALVRINTTVISFFLLTHHFLSLFFFNAPPQNSPQLRTHFLDDSPKSNVIF
jgi:hypothetical protein